MNYYGEMLYHHGIKGQKWGLRRFQNEDGSLTAAGREHYGYGSKEYYKSAKKEYRLAEKEARRAERKASSLGSRYPISSKTSMVRRNQVEGARTDAAKKRLMSDLSKKKMDMAKQEYKNSDEYKARQEKIKKAAIAGAAVAATALAAYGSYKVYKLAGDHADTILKGRLYAQKAKVDKALQTFDNRSSLAVRQKNLGMDYSEATKQANDAYSIYNQHKNNYDALASNYKNSSYIKKLKDANNLLKFNEAHGTSRKDTYSYLKSQIPKNDSITLKRNKKRK